jgi:hypothetical protein
MRYRLHPLFEMEGAIGAESGVETAPVAEEQSQVNENTADESGVESKAAAEPEKQNNFEKAFAKRLAAEREKWEKDQSEKFKGFDDYKKAAEYLQKTSGISDMLTLREEIELSELRERAEEANVTPEMLKRIDQLEAKAAEADEMKAKAQQEREWQEFETSLKTFCDGKEIDGKQVDHIELWKFMHENGVAKPEVAFKAMKAEILEAKLETAKTDAVNEYLKSKQAPKVEGTTGAAAQTELPPPSTWKEAEQRAMERLRAARQPS